VISNLTGTSLAAIFRETPIFIATMLVMLVAVTLFPDIAMTLPRLLGYAAH
jgi:C4-dicarboxylate transporter DctM subunit